MVIAAKKRLKRRGPKGRKRWLLLILLLAGGAAWLWWSIDSAPTWWAPPDTSDPAVVDLGHGTEMFVLEQLHEVREPEDLWAFRLHNNEMNAWLAVNLPAWFEHETGRPWPEQVSLPLVSAGEDGLNVGVQLPESLGDRVIALRIMPEFDDEGALRLDLNRVAIGKVSVPAPAAGALIDLLRERFRKNGAAAEEDIDVIFDMLTGERPIRPVIRLPDQRAVEVQDIELEPDAIVFACHTLRQVREASAKE